MKNEIQSMTMPKIKRLLRLRSISMVLFVLSTIVVVTSLIGMLFMQWPWTVSVPAAVFFAALMVVSWIVYLVLSKRLASGGL